MRVNYNGLWKILIDNNMKKTDLQEVANIAPATIAKMGKGEFISMETLYKVCKAFNVDIGDIVSIR